MKTVTDRHYNILQKVYYKSLFFNLNCMYVFGFDQKESTDYSLGFGITTGASPQDPVNFEKYLKEFKAVWSRAEGLDIQVDNVISYAKSHGWTYTDKDYAIMKKMFIAQTKGVK